MPSKNADEKPKKEPKANEEGIERLKSLIESISEFELTHAIALKEGQDHVPIYHIMRLALGLFYQQMMEKTELHDMLTTQGSYKCVRVFDDQNVIAPITIRYTSTHPVRITKTKRGISYVHSEWKAVFQNQKKELLAVVRFETVSCPKQEIKRTAALHQEKD